MISFLRFLALLSLTITLTVSASDPRNLRVQNDSGHKIELYWVSPQGEASLLSTPFIHDGATFPLNTFVGHRFEVREVPDVEGGDCASTEKVCRRAEFEITENDSQVAVIYSDITVEFTDNKIMARKDANQIVEDCEAQARRDLAAGKIKWAEDLSDCVEAGVAKKLEEASEELAFQAKLRTDMATLLENYTCADEHAQTTPDVRVDQWAGAKDALERLVHIKLDRPASKIHVVDNFILPEECAAMENEAARTLHRATVADGKGGSRLSENRKAMQAGITVKWEHEESSDASQADPVAQPIAQLSRRVYDYTNHVLGLEIEEHGQEDLMSIQYFGRGRNDTAPDRYTPHCDGDCTGLPHKTGTRMATMVMYCTLPDEGGATNFKNAGVHVKPKAGSAVFFSYIDPESMVMDTGFTEHSGCPVYEGQKKIVTQWIRLGVDDENPWNSFNTLGIKHTDAADQ